MRTKWIWLLMGLVVGLGPSAPATARDICTLIADASSRAILVEEGDCQSPVTPASTFKLPLALMGFEDGIITSPTTPKLPFKEGYADWGGEAWQQDTTPALWMKNSTVWYSQVLARTMGLEKLTAYGRAFGYGNADFSGAPGKNNGLERSWISSSLKISPLEQAGFIAALVTGSLPVSRQSRDGAMALVEVAGTVDGWEISGKTGSAYPRRADGNFDRTRGWGWFVGWAEKGGRTLVFARLAQDEARNSISGGLRARDSLVKQWPELLRAAGL